MYKRQGSGNAEKEAFVEKISYVLADEVPVELTKLKKVIQKLDLVTVRYDVKVVRKGFLSFSGMAFEGEELGKPTDFLWVPFLACLLYTSNLMLRFIKMAISTSKSINVG